MRKASTGKNPGRRSRKFGKYSLVGVFMIAASAATYKTVDCVTDYLEEQHQAELQIHQNEFLRLVKSASATNAGLYLKTLEYQGYTFKEIQDIRDEALLISAANGDVEAVKAALENGANSRAKDKNGLTFSELFLAKNGLAGFVALDNFRVHQNANITALYRNDRLQYETLKVADFADQEKDVIAFFDFLRKGRVDLANIGMSSGVAGGETLAELVNSGGSADVMIYLQDNDAYKGEAEPLDWSYAHYMDYLEGKDAPLIDVEYNKYKRRDFKMYDEVKTFSSHVIENSVEPHYLVIERVGEEREANKRSDHLNHIYNVSYVAHGVMKRLGPSYGSKDDRRLIAARMNLNINSDYKASDLLSYTADVGDYVIVNESIQTVPADKSTYPDLYQSGYNAPVSSLRYLDYQTDFVHYIAVGNSHKDNCITVDAVDFCVQESSYARQTQNAVRVGAVLPESRWFYAVEDYSEQNPTFCAVLPKRSGRRLSGTSFASPAAGAVEWSLADRFARSAEMPYGVVHEDILIALMLTATSSGIKDEATNKWIPVITSAGGMTMTDRCGAGVIQPQRAAFLLEDMMRWTLYDQTVTPTMPFMETVHVREPVEKSEDGWFHYNLVVPQDGMLTQLRAGLFFERNNKGAAKISFAGGEEVVLDMSSSGLTTDFRFAGKMLSKGDAVKISTTRPLVVPPEHFNDHSRTFVDLNMVQKSSPAAKAVLNKQK